MSAEYKYLRVRDVNWEGQYSYCFECLCGATVVLHFNGGELDQMVCKCGRDYLIRATGYELMVKDFIPNRGVE